MNPITLDDIVNLCNELLAIDPALVNSLVGTRHTCNEAVAEHPWVQVLPTEDGYCVGLIGILNGLIADRGRLAFHCDKGIITKFSLWE